MFVSSSFVYGLVFLSTKWRVSLGREKSKSRLGHQLSLLLLELSCRWSDSQMKIGLSLGVLLGMRVMPVVDFS